ncbi:uncharacterized protein LOC133357635 isoform X3 [Lethenteron reissneri]|uniref:uncharacterized protein LOC133357635 isoform X2 n=1 Tax=Lethenteron reissneri TaxID=7753 RepID=UPI002AB7C13F|nr:uncharacterized protein LOC133357635 isoform X2 [Lethenteron reissneri]XP_061431680.1 uncharacterized protein LOC133357635 isoform X3 [Lethenteron reissneri]
MRVGGTWRGFMENLLDIRESEESEEEEKQEAEAAGAPVAEQSPDVPSEAAPCDRDVCDGARRREGELRSQEDVATSCRSCGRPSEWLLHVAAGGPPDRTWFCCQALWETAREAWGHEVRAPWHDEDAEGSNRAVLVQERRDRIVARILERQDELHRTLSFALPAHPAEPHAAAARQPGARPHARGPLIPGDVCAQRGDVVERFYEGGRKFSTFFADGTGQVLYPSEARRARIAIKVRDRAHDLSHTRRGGDHLATRRYSRGALTALALRGQGPGGPRGAAGRAGPGGTPRVGRVGPGRPRPRRAWGRGRRRRVCVSLGGRPAGGHAERGPVLRREGLGDAALALGGCGRAPRAPRAPRARAAPATRGRAARCPRPPGPAPHAGGRGADLRGAQPQRPSPRSLPAAGRRRSDGERPGLRGLRGHGGERRAGAGGPRGQDPGGARRAAPGRTSKRHQRGATKPRGLDRRHAHGNGHRLALLPRRQRTPRVVNLRSVGGHSCSFAAPHGVGKPIPPATRAVDHLHCSVPGSGTSDHPSSLIHILWVFR